jgi:hypothetical protein
MKPNVVTEINSWGSLPLTQKLKIVDVWTMVITLANLMHIYAILIIFFPWLNNSMYGDPVDIYFGVGTFFIWLSMTMYLQFDDELNILPATVKMVSIPMLQQLISTIPIIVGLAFFNVSFFGHCWRFNNVPKSIMMLWSMWNGDEVQNLYHALSPVSIVLGPLMLYFWILFSN